MASSPTLRPDALDHGLREGRWMCVIFNNDVTPIDWVVHTLMSSTGCDRTEAEIEAWEAHTFGQTPVHFSSQKECEDVGAQMGKIGVRTEVRPEWED